MINATCDGCGHIFKNLKTHFSGKRVKCKKCGNQFRVPNQIVAAIDPGEIAKKAIVDVAMGRDVLDEVRVISTALRLPRSPSTRSTDQPGEKEQRTSRKKKSNNESLGTFRNIDIVYMVVGGLAAMRGLNSIWHLIYSIFDMATIGQRLGVEVNSFSYLFSFGFLFLVVNSLAQIALGACGATIACYIYEKRTKGTSKLAMSVQVGAIVGVIVVALRFVTLVRWGIQLSGFQSAIPTAYFFAPISLSVGTVLPVAMILLFVYRKKLRFRELN